MATDPVRFSAMSRSRPVKRLLAATGRVVGQAKLFAKEINDGVKRAVEGSRQAVLEGLRRELESIVPLVQQVMRQTKARDFAGDTHAAGKIVRLFVPTTEVIRKGKVLISGEVARESGKMLLANPI
jgi:transposase, IS5 family